MGMSYEQFWDGHPHLAVAYRKAYKLKREIENEQAWLHRFGSISAGLPASIEFPNLSYQFVYDFSPMLDESLLLGGYRLAHVLNTIFG